MNTILWETRSEGGQDILIKRKMLRGEMIWFKEWGLNMISMVCLFTDNEADQESEVMKI